MEQDVVPFSSGIDADIELLSLSGKERAQRVRGSTPARSSLNREPHRGDLFTIFSLETREMKGFCQCDLIWGRGPAFQSFHSSTGKSHLLTSPSSSPLQTKPCLHLWTPCSAAPSHLQVPLTFLQQLDFSLHCWDGQTQNSRRKKTQLEPPHTYLTVGDKGFNQKVLEKASGLANLRTWRERKPGWTACHAPQRRR